MSWTASNTYTGGAFAFTIGNPDDTNWAAPFNGPNLALAFHADLSPAAAAPEPASLTMVGLGGASLAGYFGWRRRKATTPAAA
jgi:hypothetical protein